MRLIKLEINGFKSFYHKTELQFPTGTTAVIGPNGSGKSNISDAVRWVLGEQSAKALRGTKMEDVIFNGTQQKRARSFCEVILTFDNTDGTLRSPYTEVAILRRCFRSGESEYAVNGNSCRMRDVIDLFRDTGIGKEGYSIIGQGKVEEILSNKSNDRRNAIDEAAGIMRFRVRKEEAEKKLAATEDNLSRLNDIRVELENRLEPLLEQSETARRYLSLRDELKDLDINLCLIQYDKQNQKLNALTSETAVLKQDESSTLTDEQVLLAVCASEEEYLQKLDETIFQQQNQLMELLSGVESNIGDTKLLAERKENAQHLIESHTAQIEALTAKLSHISELSDQTQNTEDLSASVQAARDAADKAESDLSEAEELCTQTENALDEKKSALMNAMNRLAEAKSGSSRFDAMVSSLEKRLEQIKAESSVKETELDGFREELRNFDASNSDLILSRDKLQNDLTRSLEDKESCEKEFADLQTSIRGDEHEVSSIQSRVVLMKEMIASREGYFTSVKSLLSDRNHSDELKRSIIGVVAELLNVPGKYETAITSALGSALQNLVVPDAEDAKFAIEYLRKKGYGRATFLPISMIRENKLNDAERHFLDLPGCFGVASELVTCDDTIRIVKEHLLGRTVIVKDLDTGILLSKKSGHSFFIVTLSGDVIATSGAMTGGSAQNNALSLLGRERELERLNRLLSEKEQQIRINLEKSEELKKKLLLLNLQTDALRNEIKDADIAVSRKEEQRQMIVKDIASCKKALSDLSSELASVSDSVAELQKEKERCLAERAEIESTNTASMADIRSLQAQLLVLRKKRDSAFAVLTDVKVSLARAENDLKVYINEKQRLVSQQAEIREEISSHRAEVSKLTETVTAIQSELDQMLSLVETERGNVVRMKEDQRAKEEDKASHTKSLADSRNSLESLRNRIQTIRDRMHRVEMDIGRLEAEKAALLDRIWRDYELTYERAAELRHPISVASSGARINEIKASIREMGTVNLNAIGEYDTVSARYRELSLQFEDLTKAKADLEIIIRDLIKSMESEFTDRFAVIQSNFTSVFKDLFGGGTAEIRLADEKDILGSDIEIIAQPPGKKLQLLSLLSGGEKALTAIALVFALLRIKPPAFCILDEIESSLDEANVTRFAEYVRSLSDATQFILITHRKGSMEACDSLYGVSMEEKGISKVVSAKFNA